MPHGRDHGRNGERNWAGISAAAEVREGESAIPAPGKNEEPGNGLELRPSAAADLVAQSGDVLQQRYRDGTAGASVGAENRTEAKIVASSTASALRANLERHGGIKPGGCGIDIDQGQIAASLAGRGRGVPPNDEDFAIPAICADDHLGLGLLGGVRREADDQCQGGGGRNQKSFAATDRPVANHNRWLT
ncbi:hypothetical protein [Methylobacterium sp.]|uniref:hypothetical protein n=1 Tax=Methylobacterium sp. TaxID=409 RepID=UPI00257DFA59|nr:hypothetical protein [Methylobacterium sp.]